jgi:hypothetical protein
MPVFRSQWVTFLAWALAAPACFDVRGGAAELSWSLFDQDGDSVDCGAARVAKVRLCWDLIEEGEAVSTICRSTAQATFDCDEQHGATRFELADGPTAFWVVPVCPDGAPAAPDSFLVPAPIVRTVEEGKVVTLRSLAIVVNDMTCATSSVTSGVK